MWSSLTYFLIKQDYVHLIVYAMKRELKSVKNQKEFAHVIIHLLAKIVLNVRKDMSSILLLRIVSSKEDVLSQEVLRIVVAMEYVLKILRVAKPDAPVI